MDGWIWWADNSEVCPSWECQPGVGMEGRWIIGGVVVNITSLICASPLSNVEPGGGGWYCKSSSKLSWIYGFLAESSTGRPLPPPKSSNFKICRKQINTLSLPRCRQTLIRVSFLFTRAAQWMAGGRCLRRWWDRIIILSRSFGFCNKIQLRFLIYNTL